MATTMPTTMPTTPTPITFQLHYRKHKYTPNTIDSALLYDIQNYIPIYSRFFDINETNYNGIQLNQKYYLQNIIEHPTDIMENTHVYSNSSDSGVAANSNHSSLNHLETVIGDDLGNTTNVPIFVKYSPLLDPIRYLSGKYEPLSTAAGMACSKITLPKYNSTLENCEEKMLNTNNSSYVDGFFSYLTSRVLHTHGIVHGLDYYGSYLCKQREFSTNVFDDIDYLADCSFFNTYENERFTIDYSQFGDDETSMHDNKWMKLRNKLNPVLNSGNKPISILEDIVDFEPTFIPPSIPCEVESSLATPSLDVVEINVDDFDSRSEQQSLIADSNVCWGKNVSDSKKMNDNSSRDSDSDSDTSQSNSSYTTIEDDECNDNENGNNHDSMNKNTVCERKNGGSNNNRDSESGTETDGEGETETDGDSENDTDENEDMSSYSDYSDDEQIIVKIKDFPIQAILLEKCVSTLDHIMMRDELTKEEWTSLLFQVIMTLVIYQKMFAFTHNDLHTNNIMFIETTEEFIYYHYDDQYYKVPTYGRIFKIIDFGRAIYKFRGELICSDSFHPKGDAATQYNFPPYYNPGKPVVEPNYSFDLCRFACALFDYFIYDLRKVEKLCKSDPIIRMVVKWTTDDKGRNVLYKSSGEERYPDFKLYKMISRSVHNHIPSKEIHNPLFDGYKITYKKYKKHASLASKFLKDGKNTHIYIDVDTLPCYCNSEV
jgi:hypothetical protein